MEKYFSEICLHIALRMITQNEDHSYINLSPSKYPRYLYKYRPCDNDAFSMLQEGYFWGSKPDVFKDLGDSKIPFNLSAEIKTISEWLLKHCGEMVYYKIKPTGMTSPKGNQVLETYLAAQNNFSTENKQKSIAEVKRKLTLSVGKLSRYEKEDVMQRLDHFASPQFEVAIEEKIKTMLLALTSSLRERVFVSCLTQRRDNQKMWEDYAKDYTGFTMEYSVQDCIEANECLDVISRLCPVTYKKAPSFPMFDMAQEHFRQELYGDKVDKLKWQAEFLKYAFYKNVDYKVEEEWRMILDNNRVQALPITGVYMGYKISQEDETRLIEICKQKNIPLFKQRFDELTGEMNFISMRLEE